MHQLSTQSSSWSSQLLNVGPLIFPTKDHLSYTVRLSTVGTSFGQIGIVCSIPGVLEELACSVSLDIAPDHAHIGVPVRSIHLVHETQGMEKLMDDDLKGDTAGLLETDLHTTSASSVGDLGIAASASRNDVNIVVLVSSSNKPCTVIISQSVWSEIFCIFLDFLD